jgi:hypothetical protein
MTTTQPSTQATQLTPEERTARAAETLVKFAKAWTVVFVVLAVIGLLAYLQTFHGPAPTYP